MKDPASGGRKGRRHKGSQAGASESRPKPGRSSSARWLSPNEVIRLARLGLPFAILPFGGQPVDLPPIAVQGPVNQSQDPPSDMHGQLSPTKAVGWKPVTLGDVEATTGWSGSDLQDAATTYYGAAASDLKAINWSDPDSKLTYGQFWTLSTFASQPTPPRAPHTIAPNQQIAYFAVAYQLIPEQADQLSQASERLAQQFPTLSSNDTTVELLSYVGAAMRGSPFVQRLDSQSWTMEAARSVPFETALPAAIREVAAAMQPRASIGNMAATPTETVSSKPGSSSGIEVSEPNLDVKISDKSLAELIAAIQSLFALPSGRKQRRKAR